PTAPTGTYTLSLHDALPISTAIEQPGSSKQHCAGADRTDPPDSPGDFSQPAHDVIVYFILLNRIPAGDEQGVDLSTHFPKSFMRDRKSTRLNSSHVAISYAV